MKYSQLEDVNFEINKVPYASEITDDWRPSTEGQDCDSYAVAKFRALVALGWPVEALRLATCWVETGAYHAVLLADLDGQTWVLDNRWSHPTPPDELVALGYKFDKYQVAGTQQWEKA